MPDKIGVPRKGVSRRSIIKSMPVVAGALISTAAAVPDASAQTKISHEIAKYQDSPKNGQQCSTCVQFQPPSACKIVANPIS